MTITICSTDKIAKQLYASKIRKAQQYISQSFKVVIGICLLLSLFWFAVTETIGSLMQTWLDPLVLDDIVRILKHAIILAPLTGVWFHFSRLMLKIDPGLTLRTLAFSFFCVQVPIKLLMLKDSDYGINGLWVGLAFGQLFAIISFSLTYKIMDLSKMHLKPIIY